MRPAILGSCDTLVMTYSTAKPFAALAALTAVADGAIGLDQPIADVWPEYAAHGKGGTTLRHVLSHQAGMYVFPEEALSIDALDTEGLIDSLARAVPLHPPGEGAGEHALTYGHLLDGSRTPRDRRDPGRSVQQRSPGERLGSPPLRGRARPVRASPISTTWSPAGPSPISAIRPP